MARLPKSPNLDLKVEIAGLGVRVGPDEPCLDGILTPSPVVNVGNPASFDEVLE